MSNFMGSISQPQEVNRIVGAVKPISCLRDTCLLWLHKAIQAGLVEWLQPLINSSLSSGMVPDVKKRHFLTTSKEPACSPLLLSPSATDLAGLQLCLLLSTWTQL